MFGLKEVRGWDLVSMMLLVAALGSLLLAASTSLQPAPAAIPEHLLNRVRGSNPSYYQQVINTCTNLVVSLANDEIPPPVPPYVAYDACTALGQPCILCLIGAGSTDYALEDNDGSHPNIWPKPIHITDCNPQPQDWGLVATCDATLKCNGGVDFDCNTSAESYGSQ